MDMFAECTVIGSHAKAVTALKYSPCGEFLISACKC